MQNKAIHTEHSKTRLAVVALPLVPGDGWPFVRLMRDRMESSEPWYGVRLVYRLTGFSRPAYEERIIIVRAASAGDAIATAEQQSTEYESETTQYIGYAMAFHIFDASGPCLGPGVEVFSLIRESELEPHAYLDRFHDSGRERTKTGGAGTD